MKTAWADEPTSKVDKPSQKNVEPLLQRQAKAYANSSTIHGLTYIAEEGRPCSEKLCWIFVTIAFSVLCGLLIAPVFLKWRDSPTYTSINTTNFPVWDIPFPGVTVCSNILVHNFHLTADLLNNDVWRDVMSAENLTDIDDLFYLVDAAVTAMISLQTKNLGDDYVGFGDEEVEQFADKYKKELADMMRHVGHSCGYMLLDCYWQGEKTPCGELFETSRTDVGFCCSFNTVKLAEEAKNDFEAKDISLSYYDDVDTADGTGEEYDPFKDDDWYDGYYHDDEEDSNDRKKRSTEETDQEKGDDGLRIFRSNSASSTLGLSVVLDVDRIYYSGNEQYTMNDYYGFKVLVHSPYDYPEVGSKGFTVGGGNVAFIGVDARRTSSTEKVRSMSINRRNCIRHDESRDEMDAAGVVLDIFANYSRPACLMECRAREMYKRCDCLPYFYPAFSKFWGIDTSCDADGLKCVFQKSGILNALNTGAPGEFFAEGATCNCPIDCDDNVYMPEMSQAKLRPDASILKNKLEGDLDYQLAERFVDFFEGVDAELNRSIAVLERCVQGKDLACHNPFFQASANATSESESLLELKRKLFAEKARQEYAQDKLEYWRDANRTNHEVSLEDTAVIHVYFKQLGIVEYVRDELYSASDFIAAVGGLIGLCTGFSLISLVEIIYWFTNRLWNDGRRKNRTKQMN